ncbi:MAG: metallophosphoesterase [Pirellulales bacterium]|nr:metallophosphoesterase [Pirellulales bacterium]
MLFLIGIQSLAPAAPPDLTPGSWTLAILPDTQHYAERHPTILTSQVQFLADSKEKLNLAFVLQEGDATNRNTPAEWKRVSKAFALLEKAGVDYLIAPGNHDYPVKYKTFDGRSASLMNEYFPVTRLKKQPTFGGVWPGEPDSTHNSYSLFSAGGTDWLVLALEFGPRNEVVAWADKILKKYPKRKAMIVTHAYLYCDGTRYDWAAKGNKQAWSPHSGGYEKLSVDVNDGEEMWNKLKGNANLKFVFCGHVLNDGEGYLVSRGDHGNVVHQILANYQFLRKGGLGYMRLMEFLPDGETVHVRTYSPWLDKHGKNPNRTEASQDFVLKLSSAPAPEKTSPVP